MAFLDETGLAELWSLVKVEDGEVKSALTALINGKAQIVTGTYVGTNTYGASNPNSLTFSFAPKLLIITGRKNGYNGQWTQPGETTSEGSSVADLSKTTTAYVNGGVFPVNNLFGKKSADGKTISWYSTQSAEHQYNYKLVATDGTYNYTYSYIAIG